MQRCGEKESEREGISIPEYKEDRLVTDETVLSCKVRLNRREEMKISSRYNGPITG